MRIVPRLILPLAVLALAAAACKNDNMSSTTPVLSQADADSLAATVTSDVDAEITTATLDGLGGGAIAASARVDGSPTSLQCTPAKSPNPPANADSDAVPDSVRFDYAGCVVTRPLGVDSISGTIDVIDPTPTAKDHSVERVFTNFERLTTSVLTGEHWSVTSNGVRRALRDTTTLNVSETNFRTDFVGPKGGTSEHVRTWESIFTADVAGSIQPNTLLPSGSWSVNGTSSWTRGQKSYSLTVTTDPALHYNASCTDAPRFDAGKITAVVTKASQTMTVTIEFTACGQYTVTRS
jgi:hypothetical protein